MARDDVYYGRAVENPGTPEAVVRFFSVSSLEKGDATRDGGCLRKWWYRYVAGIAEEQRAASALGDQVHEQIASYLTTGVDALGPVARLARHLLPKPGTDLEVEASICPVRVEGDRAVAALDQAPLRLDGTPLIGKIDLRHRRGVHCGGIDLNDCVDPGGTVEVCDHKTSSRPELAATPDRLRRSIQMVGYGEHSRLVYPGTTWVRLSHHVIPTMRREPARKVTVRVRAEEIAGTWRTFEPLARTIKATACAPSAEDVQPSEDACAAYGGCAYRNRCSASRSGQLVKLFGARGAPERSAPMSLLDDLDKPAAPKLPAIPDDFREAVSYIDSPQNLFGTPKYGGEAAVLRAAIDGKAIPLGASLPGSGRLAGNEISDVATVVKLGGELKSKGIAPKSPAPAPAPAPPPIDLAIEVGLVPPDAPAPTPAPPVVSTTPPPAAPVDAPAPAAPASAPEEPAKRRGRPPKSATSTAVDHVTPASAPEVVILADAFTVGAQSLDAVVAEYAAKIATQAGAPDIRASEHEALKFGKWKGVLAAMAREGVAALAPGWYTIDTRGDFGAVVVEAVAGLGNVRIVRGAR